MRLLQESCGKGTAMVLDGITDIRFVEAMKCRAQDAARGEHQ